ncbi:MAG TPA: DUF2752 domain-containing protein [Polyangiaceae bacterium]|nr:DUF2752 domain-containing protein [Polyangiaceae bacterium]
MAMPPSPAGFWDLDEPPVPLGRRTARAAAVGAAWVAGAMPALFGRQRCTVAALLHRPCPGCGMTRAIELLAAGEARASLRLHPLAVPALLVAVSFAAATVAATLRVGSPLRTRRTGLGRIAIAAAVVVYGAAVVLWAARWFGFFGGPVPV